MVYRLLIKMSVILDSQNTLIVRGAETISTYKNLSLYF
jgi:hypothetical protein